MRSSFIRPVAIVIAALATAVGVAYATQAGGGGGGSAHAGLLFVLAGSASRVERCRPVFRRSSLR
jgi:hypothetical protein